MTYNELVNSKISTFGNINIVCGYPGIGKTRAAKMMKHDKCFKVIDLDSGDFKKNPGVTDENWVDLYVRKIKTIVSDIGMDIALKGDDDKTTYYILISSHLEVRKALSEENIPFIYVRPTFNDIPVYLEHNVVSRATDPKWRRRMTPQIMRSIKYAEDTVAAHKNGTAKPEDELPNQILIEVSATFDGDKKPKFTYMSDVLYAMSAIPFEYRNNNVISQKLKDELQILTANWLFDKMYNKIYGIKGQDVYKLLENAQFGINSHGHPYMVWTERTGQVLKKFIKRNHLSKDVSDRLANQGSCFVVLYRADAENIVQMLNSAIQRLESGERIDNDIEVFGDLAISYERLIDELDHTVLPIKKSDDGDEEAE